MAVRCQVEPPSDVCQTRGREAGSDEVTVPFAFTLYSALPGVAASSGFPPPPTQQSFVVGQEIAEPPCGPVRFGTSVHVAPPLVDSAIAPVPTPRPAGVITPIAQQTLLLPQDTWSS